jgi:hypothetical protein
MMRERIIYNNSLNSYEKIPEYGHNLDLYYLARSMENEQKLADLKIEHPAITDKLVKLLN